MRITTSQTDGIATIKFEGDLLISGVADAKLLVVAAMAEAKEIRLDLGAVGDCDTAGLQFLLMARADARFQGRRLVATFRSASVLEAMERVGIPAGCFDNQEGAE